MDIHEKRVEMLGAKDAEHAITLTVTQQDLATTNQKLSSLATILEGLVAAARATGTRTPHKPKRTAHIT